MHVTFSPRTGEEVCGVVTTVTKKESGVQQEAFTTLSKMNVNDGFRMLTIFCLFVFFGEGNGGVWGESMSSGAQLYKSKNTPVSVSSPPGLLEQLQ